MEKWVLTCHCSQSMGCETNVLEICEGGDSNIWLIKMWRFWVPEVFCRPLPFRIKTMWRILIASATHLKDFLQDVDYKWSYPPFFLGPPQLQFLFPQALSHTTQHNTLGVIAQNSKRPQKKWMDSLLTLEIGVILQSFHSSKCILQSRPSFRRIKVPSPFSLDTYGWYASSNCLAILAESLKLIFLGGSCRPRA